MYFVSACLAGFPCRYNGTVKADPKIVDMVKKGEAIPICPEQLGGLTTPRTPAEIQRIVGEVKVRTKSQKDVTSQFLKGAQITVELAKRFNIKKAILKSNSPSCGCGWIYDGSFSGKLCKGDGITTQALKSAGIEVITEKENPENTR